MLIVLSLDKKDVKMLDISTAGIKHSDATMISTAGLNNFCMTKRLSDSNGFIVIKNNPISKIGVFDYLGKSINAPNPDKVYRVWRPEASLNNEETIRSFQLLPWIDDHEMLGAGFTPAEQKGVEGIIGENVYYEKPYLKANLKIFSEDLKQKILSGDKIELSAGYKCKYLFEQGTTPDGEMYDAIQTRMLGNHLALVTEGRMGADVAVQDSAEFTFSIDSKDIIMEEVAGEKPTITLESLAAQVAEIAAVVKELKSLEVKEAAPVVGDADETKEEKEGKATDADPEAKKDDDKGMDASIVAALQKEIALLRKEVQANGMDAVHKRDELYKTVSPLIGAFDHGTMTEQALAKYAVDKLGLTGCDGAEVAAVKAYALAASKTTNKTQYTVGTGVDSAGGENSVTKFLKGV